jgi:hypothetical protein
MMAADLGEARGVVETMAGSRQELTKRVEFLRRKNRSLELERDHAVSSLATSQSILVELRTESRRLRAELKAQASSALQAPKSTPPATPAVQTAANINNEMPSHDLAPPVSPMRPSAPQASVPSSGVDTPQPLSPGEAAAMHIVSEASSNILFGSSPARLPAFLALSPATEKPA